MAAAPRFTWGSLSLRTPFSRPVWGAVWKLWNLLALPAGGAALYIRPNCCPAHPGALAAQRMSQGHVKLLIATEKGYVIGNITGAKDSLDIRESAGTGQKAQLTLNARVQMEPDMLERIVKEEIA